MKDIRYKVCLGCKKGVRVFPDNYASKMLEKWFDVIHGSHMTQILSIEELSTQKDKYDIILKKP